MPSFTPDPKVLPVVRQLFLLEFTPLEMANSLAQSVGRTVLISEVEDHIAYLHEQWLGGPELEAVNLSEGTLWARSEMFRNDMLGLYADQIANARATMHGDYNHADGRPVIKTKPSEVLFTAEKILTLERAVIQEQRQALLRLKEATTGPVIPPPAPARFKPGDEEDEEVTAPERTEL